MLLLASCCAAGAGRSGEQADLAAESAGPCTATVDAGTLNFSAAPVSPLVPGQALRFGVAQGTQGAASFTVLALLAAGGPTRPLARITAFGEGTAARVCVQRLAPDIDGTPHAELAMALAGHLYGLVLGQEATARYCLAGGTQPCEPALAQADVLRQLARERDRLWLRLPAAGRPARWQMVALSPGPVGRDPDQVSVRLADARGRPMRGTRVYFNRAPHSGCMARSQAQGVASCRLVDQHGDDEAHGDSEQAPVLVTFPGLFDAGRSLPPMTLVMRNAHR